MRQLITGTIAALVALTVIIGLWWGWKNVQVWSAEMRGKAILAEANYSKQSRVMEAQAKKDAAKLEGEAEYIRAQYAADANAALAENLGGAENYLRYLYIRMLEEQDNGGSIIYIPTEAGMPVLEAGRGVQ